MLVFHTSQPVRFSQGKGRQTNIFLCTRCPYLLSSKWIMKSSLMYNDLLAQSCLSSALSHSHSPAIYDSSNNNECISKALFHVKRVQLR